MDLIPRVVCPRCGTEYSSLQSRCPKCGTRKVKQTQRAPGGTSGTVAGTYANDQAQVNAKWQMTFAAILVVAVILSMIVLISTSLKTGDSNKPDANVTPDPNVNVVSPSLEPTPTPTPSPTPPAITSINLYYSNLTTPMTEFTEKVGETVPLKVTVYPLEIPPVINWSSSDENVCTVEGDNISCKITGVGKGKATVTAECYGKTATVTVYVKEG